MKRLGALVVAGLVLAGCGLKDPYAATSTAKARPRAAVVRASPPAGMPAGHGDAVAAARLFMRGYLPYLYGLGPARAIGAVKSALRHSLAAQPMTREDGASPSHPQLEALRALSQNGRVAVARAIVSDESGVYFAVDLALVRGADGWQVTALKTVGG